MSRSSPVESSPQSALHPRLQQALGSLDMELDDELVRYRRSGRRLAPIPPAETGDRPSVEANSIVSPPSPPPPDRSVRSPLPAATAAAAVAAGVVAIAPQVPTPEPPSTVPVPTSSGFDDTAPPDDYLASSEELLRQLSEDEAPLRPEQEPGLLQTLLTPLGIGSMLLLLLSSVTFGYLFTNPNSLKFLGLEKLLQTSDPEPSVVASPLPTAASPQASAISPDLSQDEFVDLNLATLSTLPSGTASPVPAPTTAPTTVAAQPSTPSAPTVSVPAAAPAPASRSTSTTQATTTAANPAPATRSSGTTATRTTQSAPARRSPTTTTAPARPSTPPRQTTAARPAPAPVRPPASPVVSPSPARSSAPVAASTAPPREDLYYVVTDYTGDNSLNEARQAVGDAYVRNLPNRAVVQMGAFSEPGRAQELQRDLEQQGISAQVYQADP